MAHNRREVHAQVLAATNSEADTPEVQFSSYAGGTIAVPVGSPVTQVTIHGQLSIGGEWYLAASNLGVTAGNMVSIPASVYGCIALKFVADAAGDIEVSGKS